MSRRTIANRPQVRSGLRGRYLRETRALELSELLVARYQKFRRMGEFEELLTQAVLGEGPVNGQPQPA